jgi:2,5-diketo-D-gluconate reductase A
MEPARAGRRARRPGLAAIAQVHGKTPAQVVLRWHLQLGNVVFPKSVTPRRIEENIAVLEFHLSKRELGRIGELDRGRRIGPDPDTFVRP